MLINEKNVRFKSARSSGPGGQNANRRSTKVQLWVRVGDLPISEIDKKILRKKLAHHINHLDEIWVENEEERLQEANKEKAFAHLNQLITDALKKEPIRIPTEPPRGLEEERIRLKKFNSRKKQARREF